jgi:predicted nucleotide-binding protein
MGYLVSDRKTLLKRFDELIEHGKALLPFQNDLGYLAKKQKWVTGCQHILETALGRESVYCRDFQNLPRLGNQEAHITHGLALMKGAREEVEKGTLEQVPSKSSSTDTRKVFIVHGRDYESVKELKTMLLEFGLDPIILHEQPSRGRTVVEKLEDHSSVGYAFAVLSPDDHGISDEEVTKLLSNALGKENPNAEDVKSFFKTISAESVSALSRLFFLFKPRARQNVVMEFGYFWGLLGRDRVCCLYKGDVELPSDMHGIVYVPFKDSVDEAKDMIIKELRAAGYEIKTKEKGAKEGTEDELKKLG